MGRAFSPPGAPRPAAGAGPGLASGARLDDPLAPEQLDIDRRVRERRVQRHRERLRRRRRIRRRQVTALALVGLAVWFGVTLFGGSRPFHLLARPPTPVRLTSLIRANTVVPGDLGPMPWPTAGQAAISVLGTGIVASSPREAMVPIASLTKMMTALVFLHDHPLALGAEGPSFKMTAADVRAWVTASQTDESNVPVQVGEVLTEQQLLEALLIPSADNIADFLAEYDAGSIPAFVAKMNAMARSLGLRHTSYADASGVNPLSRSTAADQAVIAAKLMTDPTVRSIVSKPSLAFPVAGTIWNYNPALGTDGIIGVKSGYTSEAQGCLATAAYHEVGNKSVLVVSVALGQQDGLYGAARTDEALLAKGASALRLWRPSFSTSEIAQSAIGSAVTPLALSAPAPIIVAWPGLRLRTSVVAVPSSALGSQTASTATDELVVSAPFGVLERLPLVAAATTGGTETVNVADGGSTSVTTSPPNTPGGLAAGG